MIEGQNRYIDVRDVQSLVGTNRQHTASQFSDNANLVDRNRREHTRLLATTDSAEEQAIRCQTLPGQVQVAPIQVGDPRKIVANKKGADASPNQTVDSNRITALDDMNRRTL